MRALVTGASGFIGRHVVAEMRRRGHEVDAPGLEGSRLDLTVPGEVAAYLDSARPEVLVHAAWYAGDDRLTSPENIAWVGHSACLIDEFLRRGGRRFVTLGTCFEYQLGGGCLSETATPVAPHTVYGAAKAATGALSACFGVAGVVSAAHARIGYVYGPGERPPRVVPALIEALAAGRRFAATDGEQRRDYLHVADVASAVATIAESDVMGAVNVGSGESIAVRDLVRAVAEALERPDLVDFGALPARPDGVDDITLDVARLAGLGWSPRFSIASGVADTIRQALVKEVR